MYDPLNLYRGRYKEFIESIKELRPLNERFEYSHNHHIIPKSTFLDKTHPYKESRENKIYLTYSEHFIAHRILAEDNPTNKKLVNAFWWMCNSKIRVATPEEYEEASKMWSDTLRESMLGEGNPNYDTIVVNNGEVQRHIHVEELSSYEAEGYVRGALPKSDITRKRLSESLEGHEVVASTREHLSEAQYRYLETHTHQRVGCVQSPESRKSIADKASIRNRGEGNPMYGKRGKDSPIYGIKRSEETRKKHSISKLGNPSNTGRICINNGEHNKFIFPEEYAEYESLGYKRGKIRIGLPELSRA